jgi:hypothetical protein
MPARRTKKKCLVCSKPVDGPGAVCSACAGRSSTAAEKRVAVRVRDRMSGGAAEEGEFVCPYCRKELGWSTIGMTETEVTIYVREKIYYCPECRSFLGVSSWHTEG